MENIDIYSEFFGLIATFFMFYSFTKTNDKTLIILHTVSNVFWGLHFLVLGALAGAVSILFSLSRTAFVFKWNSKEAKLGFMFVLTLYCIYEASSIDNIHNILPIIAAFIVSLGILFFDKNKLTLIFIISNILWVNYTIIVGSISGTISYSIIILILIYRWIKIKKEIDND